METKLEKVKFLIYKYGLTILEAKKLVDQFESVDEIVHFLKNTGSIDFWTKFMKREEHFNRYGHYLFHLKEEHKHKVSFMDQDFYKKVRDEYFPQKNPYGYKYYSDDFFGLYDLKPLDDMTYELYDLLSKFEWKKDSVVYYLGLAPSCIKSIWEIVCEYWTDSIHEDKFNLIINPESEIFLTSIEYDVYIGKKTKLNTI